VATVRVLLDHNVPRQLAEELPNAHMSARPKIGHRAPTSQPAPIDQLAQRVADYIRKERDRLLPFATPLLAEDRTALEGFFEREFLDGVRVVVGMQVREPAFLRELDRFDLPIPSVSLAEALTLDCLIASNETLRLHTLVHEMIHAIQYRALGIDAFACRYVAEYLSYGYEQMPLESAATELAARFVRGESFQAEPEIVYFLGANP
jgi:hypothetical protein